MKAGLDGYAFSKQILQTVGQNKRFCKWLMKNRADIWQNDYYVDVILRSLRTGRPLLDLQNIRKNQQVLKKAVGIFELRTSFKDDIEKFVAYLGAQNISVYSYNDYFNACNYPGLNMTEDKNRYPHDFKRWHDIRIDEYNTAKAIQTVSKYMGHSDSTITLEVYSHFIPDTQEKVIFALNNLTTNSKDNKN